MVPIVADGRDRAHDAAIGKVRAEVEREFADALRKAGPWRRVCLWIKAKREIRRRMARIAPLRGLYLRAGRKVDRRQTLVGRPL
jgi:hypothetical protein